MKILKVSKTIQVHKSNAEKRFKINVQQLTMKIIRFYKFSF